VRLARPALLLLVALALTLAVVLVVQGRDPAALGPLPADPFAGSVDPVLVGAGDIADCRLEADSRTADLLDVIGGTVFTAGDNAYDTGSLSEYERCYGPTWGRHRARTRPAVGSHEYLTEAGSGYRAYWGDAAGPRGEFWYSFDLGAWHVVVLDSNCTIIACGPGSPQLEWLRADLAASDALCTAAIWHHPRFTSGQHGDDTDVAPLWDELEAAGGDVVLSGHDHDYERFAPIGGIREFVVGTGGAALRRFPRIHEGSEARNDSTHGVLALRLRPDAYDWSFVPVAGGMFTDNGSDVCR
jgi:hypothetical protein